MKRRFLLSIAGVLMASLALAPSRSTHASDGYRISGPYTHDNLAIYLIHGASAAGAVPLTLEEALAKGSVRVRETGQVNELALENLGGEEVFVQSGDIVKGGQQDRVLMVSLVVPPHSGWMPIGSFCVEQGRWTARGAEDPSKFASASTAVPSRDVKLAMKAPIWDGVSQSQAASTGTRQTEVWNEVAQMQKKLSVNLGTPVASPQSKSSLQPTLENAELRKAQSAFVAALQSVGESEADIIGYAFAIDGKLNSADIYSSNALFRKMWPKLLTAAATETLASGTNDARPAPPPTDAVTAFLETARSGKASEKQINRNVVLETRESDGALSFETRRASAGAWVHQNILAR